MRTKVGQLHEKIANYNKFRRSHQGIVFTTFELKTEFEKMDIPFNYRLLPFYIQFGLIDKQARNKYTMPSKVIHKTRLVNAWKSA